MKDNSDKATGYYIKSIQLDERNAVAHFRLGLLFYRQKKGVEARTELAKAIKLDPDNAEAHYYLGRMLKDSGDYTGALASFERAQKSPDLKVKALVDRGGTYLAMKNYDRAASDLARAIRIAPPEKAGSPEVLYGRYFLSVCHERSRQMEKAIEQWELIYAKNPRFQDVAEKLSQYQDLRTDDNIKDYVTAGEDDFMQMCQEALRASNLTIHDTRDVPNGCQLIASENESKWRNARRVNRMFWFLRVPEMITDSAVRGLLTTMRESNIQRGAIFTSSGFSRTARAFAESRPIDLYDKEQLQKLLARIDRQS
jgi:tetratricopeptide (TPR) repeat protein